MILQSFVIFIVIFNLLLILLKKYSFKSKIEFATVKMHLHLGNKKKLPLFAMVNGFHFKSLLNVAYDFNKNEN